MTKFTELLRQYIDRNGITISELARRTGVNRQTIGHWLEEERETPIRPQYNNVISCAEALNLTPQERQLFIKASVGLLDDKSGENQLTHGDPVSESSLNAQNVDDFPMSQQLAGAIFVDYIPRLFNQLPQLHPYPVILLLTQAHWDEPPCREAILLKAKQIYSAANVLHIHLPYSANVDAHSYFVELGEQCQMECVKDSYDFEKILKKRLKKTRHLFLLVSRFEQAGPLRGQDLASIIRNVSETYPNRFHVMLCGSQKLADLKYQEGSLSLLNFARIEHWPELGPQEVKALSEHRFPEVKLTEDTINQLLEISGGHPQLLNECLQLQQQSSLKLTDYLKQLMQSDVLWQSFQPYQDNESVQQRLCEWLNKETFQAVASWQPYIQDELLRDLYWKNLLVWRDNGLYWRCEAIRMAGKKILCG